jgi:hypothetical protein
VLLAAGVACAVIVGHRRTAVHLEAKMSIEAPDELVVLEPEDWVGKSFPVLNEMENSTLLRSGRWLVVLYHSDCDRCLEAIPRYQALAVSDGAKNAGIRLAFVAMPPVSIGADPVACSPDYLHLALRPDHDWFATTPLVAAIEDGKVIWAGDGDSAVNPPRFRNGNGKSSSDAGSGKSFLGGTASKIVGDQAGARFESQFILSVERVAEKLNKTNLNRVKWRRSEAKVAESSPAGNVDEEGPALRRRLGPA